MNNNDLELVHRHALFQGLSVSQLERIVKGSTGQSFTKGYMLFNRGEPADYFYFVFDGWVKIYRETLDGNEAIIGVFTCGETIAEAVALGGSVYPASAEVIEPARVLAIRSSTFAQHLRANPDMGLAMLSTLSRRVHLLVGEIESLKTQTATQRVSQFLLKLCTVQEGATVIALPYDKSVISGRLGIQPESLSRILAKLRKLGVKSEQGRVVIPDVALLRQFCAGDSDVECQKRA